MGAGSTYLLQKKFKYKKQFSDHLWETRQLFGGLELPKPSREVNDERTVFFVICYIIVTISAICEVNPIFLKC